MVPVGEMVRLLIVMKPLEKAIVDPTVVAPPEVMTVDVVSSTVMVAPQVRELGLEVCESQRRSKNDHESNSEPDYLSHIWPLLPRQWNGLS